MRHRWGRWSLVVLAAAVAAGAAGWTLRIEGAVREIRAGAVAAGGYASNGRTALQDVRRAVAAMASPGPAAAGWGRRAEAALDDARRQMEALIALAPAADGRAAIDVFERLAESERRLREHATGGKPLMAADVAFGEAMPHIDDLERRLDVALDAVSTAADRAVAARRDRQVAALAGAIGVLLAAALVLAPLPRHADLAAPPAEEPAAADNPAAAPDASGPVPDMPAISGPPLPAVDLPGLGAVCERLAAMREANALPGLLDDAARAIGARGMILWLADASRQRLQIAAMTGYDPRLVERIGPVSMSDDHATARAFRSATTLTSPAGPGVAPAAAIPVRGPAAVVGVLTLELIDQAPHGVAAATAAATILAAQLAGLIGGDAEAAPVAQAAP